MRPDRQPLAPRVLALLARYQMTTAQIEARLGADVGNTLKKLERAGVIVASVNEEALSRARVYRMKEKATV